MKINLTYNIGDKICVNGVSYKILSMHLYITKNNVTERYYLGNAIWVTLSNGKIKGIDKNKNK